MLEGQAQQPMWEGFRSLTDRGNPAQLWIGVADGYFCVDNDNGV